MDNLYLLSHIYTSSQQKPGHSDKLHKQTPAALGPGKKTFILTEPFKLEWDKKAKV